jgi:hypothetical protein
MGEDEDEERLLALPFDEPPPSDIEISALEALPVELFEDMDNALGDFDTWQSPSREVEGEPLSPGGRAAAHAFSPYEEEEWGDMSEKEPLTGRTDDSYVSGNSASSK